jgi:hypothetical protein
MRCVHSVVSLSSMRYIFRQLLPFFVDRFCEQILSSDCCPQNFSSTFIKPSAKPTRARVLGTYQSSRTHLL